MTEISDRFATVAGGLSDRVEHVAAAAWDGPSPCGEWSARDVLRHIVGNAAHFLALAGAPLPDDVSVDVDPARAWALARAGLQAALEDPRTATSELDGPAGRSTLEQAIAQFGIGDVLVHTWDLARATGGDETLDPEEVRRLLASMLPRDETMRQSGNFGPRVEVPEGADEQTGLLAFTGRRP